MKKKYASSNTFNASRPPIVTVLGHVDHGKTTLLDTIRKTNVATKEIGGITQHIGAYQVEHKGKKITFIDTPGHEAFIKMRQRGGQVADIALLVIAVNDGIKPQTKESIEIIKSSNIPAILTLNKCDLANSKAEKIKKQISAFGFNLEEYGGDTPVILISAKNNIGIDKLLDMILLVAELQPERLQFKKQFEGVVIESSLSRQMGAIATVIIRSGNIDLGKEVICDQQIFRVRAILNWQGKKMNQTAAGDPVQILGWKKVPAVGSRVYDKDQLNITIAPAHSVTSWRKPFPPSSLSPLALEENRVKLILRADTAGTLEAILAGLKDTVTVISSSVGSIAESDVLLAKTTNAIIIGFHQVVRNQVMRLAQSERVIIKTYNVIYELFDELEEVIETLQQGNLVNVLGEAVIVAMFKYSGENVAGVNVLSGRIARGDKVKVMRKDTEVGRARIKSLRQLKEDITKAEEGKEAGVLLSQKIDFLTGDSIISIG